MFFKEVDIIKAIRVLGKITSAGKQSSSCTYRFGSFGYANLKCQIENFINNASDSDNMIFSWFIGRNNKTSGHTISVYPERKISGCAIHINIRGL